MSRLSKFNKGSRYSFKASKDFEFVKLKDLYAGSGDPNYKYYVRGLVVFNTKYGDSPCAVLDNCYASLPSFMTATIQDMIRDDDVFNAIEENKAYFTIRVYEDEKHGAGQCYAVEWGEDE